MLYINPITAGSLHFNSLAATGDYSRPPDFTPLATKVDKTCSLPKVTSVAHIMFITGIIPDCAKTRGKTRHWDRV